MARKYSNWEMAYQKAWVHYWRRQWYDNIIKGLKK